MVAVVAGRGDLALNTKALKKEGTHSPRISLTARGLHNCAHDGTGRLQFATTNLLCHVRLLGERRIDCFEQWTVITHHGQTARSYDFVG